MTQGTATALFKFADALVYCEHCQRALNVSLTMKDDYHVTTAQYAARLALLKETELAFQQLKACTKVLGEELMKGLAV